MPRYRPIRFTEETADKLKAEKRGGETYEDVVVRLLRELEVAAYHKESD
jgi:hypothetical protein